MPIQPYPTYQPWQGQYTTQFPTYQAPQMVQPYQQPVNGVVKVNGRDSALQYNLPPNSMSPALFDSNGKVFYIVSTDGAGAKSVECFDFSPHVEQQPVQIDGAQFVSRAEFDEFAAKVKAVIGADDGVHGSVQSAGEQHSSAADAAGAASLPRHAAGR